MLDDDDLLGDMIEDSPLLCASEPAQLKLQKERSIGLGLAERSDFEDSNKSDLNAMSPVKDESPLLPAARAYRGDEDTTPKRPIQPYSNTADIDTLRAMQMAV